MVSFQVKRITQTAPQWVYREIPKLEFLHILVYYKVPPHQLVVVCGLTSVMAQASKFCTIFATATFLQYRILSFECVLSIVNFRDEKKCKE